MEVVLSDEDLANLREVPAVLRSLDLSKAPISDEGLTHLRHLHNLRNLSLAQTKVTGSGLAALRDAQWLRRLILTGAPIGNEGVSHLTSLPRLEILDLGDTKITTGALEDLQSMSCLRELNLGGTGIKPADLQVLRAALPKCRITTSP